MDKRTQNFRQNVNDRFFEKSTPKVAYVLGCFASDGGMFINSGNSKYIQFTSTNKNFLKNIKNIIKAKQKITTKKNKNKNWKKCYVLQIGSKKIFDDLKKIGFLTNKSKNLAIPSIPDKLFSHFVRGYFEGDGCVWCGSYRQKNRLKSSKVLQTHFICGDQRFLEKFSKNLKKATSIEGGSLVKKNRGFDLLYAKKDSRKIYNFIYNNKRQLFSKEKYNRFTKAIKVSGGRSSAG